MSDELNQVYERLLIARCQAGDADAFTEIVGRDQLRLSYYLRKTCCPEVGVDDLLQDVWLDVFRSLDKLRDQCVSGLGLLHCASPVPRAATTATDKIVRDGTRNRGARNGRRRDICGRRRAVGARMPR